MSFTVTRTAGSLVGPSEPTPPETLDLSIIDRVPGLRHMVRSLHVYAHGAEPAGVIREALAKALVQYHPFAGRFVGSGGGEVRVECNGEGAWFVEATADCRLEDVKYLDHPLLISQEELLPYPCPEIDPINKPIMMQVTEFKCGGFVVGIVCVHTLADGLGAAQFHNAIADLARGLSAPTTSPVWSRHLIPNPPKLPLAGPPAFPSFKLRYATADLPPSHIAKTKALYLDSAGHHCSTFDVSIATAWQSRIKALGLEPDHPVQVCFFASTRHLLAHVLPKEGGYYGNCFYPVTVGCRSGQVAESELVEVVRMIRNAKARLPAEFAKWAAGDFKEDPYELTFSYDSLFVSDWTRVGLYEVDYGWGKPVNIVPFAYHDFMAVAIIGAPPAPKKGVRLMTQCVEEEHLPAFREQLNSFVSA